MADELEIVVGEAPPHRSTRGKWDPLLDAGRANPGEWVSAPSNNDSAVATNIRNCKYGNTTPVECWEARCVGKKPDARLYVRYLGTTDDPIDMDEVA